MEPADPVAPRPPAGGLDEAVDEVERQFATLMAGSQRRMRDFAALVHPDLSALGFAILLRLNHVPDLPQTELAQQLHADKGAVSRSVTLLEEVGLVARSPAPGDRRVALVRLTDTARERLAVVGGRQRQVLYDRVAGWPLPEVRELGELLARLNDISEESGEG